jgi:hypothetical protein
MLLLLGEIEQSQERIGKNKNPVVQGNGGVY